ncbi:MAG: serine/threonine-protein kinase [Planctomycetaceae bacterium]
MDPQGGRDDPASGASPAESGADPGRVADDEGRGLPGADDSFGFGAAATWTRSGELPSGADLGGVTILRLLAEGGMGRVYEARQERPRRTVAVKVLREGAVPATAPARLLREAETLAALRHPHIAQVHTCGTAPPAYGGGLFLVMEFVEGARSITRFAAVRGLSIRARVALFHKVCDAVAHGHRHGVIHRDLKPANILVDAGGEPKVIDYGIARSVDGRADGPRADGSVAPAADVTATGDVVGTLRYMSPEQLLTPTAPPDARSDVYALGLILHELLVG